jgi:hypothetical protein
MDFDSQLWFQNLSLMTIYDEKHHVLYCIVSKGHWGLLYLSFFVHVSTFITLMTTGLGMDKLSSNYHYTALTDRLGGG